MCNVKTMNLSLNVSQPEGAFWKRLALKAGARSVGDFHKRLLMSAVAVMNPAAGRELLNIRLNHRGLGSAALLALFVAGAIVQGGHKELRRAQQVPRPLAVRVEKTF
jgi:hypothetical protein